MPVLLLLLVLLSGCTHPTVPELLPQAGEMVHRQPFSQIYPSGHWQFVHSIHFELDHGADATMLGVTSGQPDLLQCALLSSEGLTLFQASQAVGDQVVVERAVPPFDRPVFAQGLLADVQLLFQQPPPCVRVKHGRRADNMNCSRLVLRTGTIDICQPPAPGCWQISHYDSGQRLNRQALAQDCQKHTGLLLPDKITLKNLEHGYTLNLKLIQATRKP